MNKILSTENIPEPTDLKGPTEQVVCALLRAAHSVEKRLEDSLEQVGLSGPKFAVLRQLVLAGEPLSLKEVASRLTCVRSNITQLMDRLEADGLVRRIEDPSDRRGVRAELTPLGVKRQSEGMLRVEAVQKELTEALTGIDHHVFVQALAAIT